MTPSSIVHQASEDQTHSSMVAWRVREAILLTWRSV
jgi:hypothetical protein